MEYIFCYITPIVFVVIGILLSFKTEILKDKSKIDKSKISDSDLAKPYSFARTQLMWWTLIIIALYAHGIGLTFNEESLIELNDTCLILLGISLGTTVSARIIDNTDINNNLERHQDKSSKGFLIDILKDENGISIHRFQALAFNIIFGIIFISKFFSTHVFLDFEQYELGLIGISSAAYVGLKINENTTKKSG